MTFNKSLELRILLLLKKGSCGEGIDIDCYLYLPQRMIFLKISAPLGVSWQVDLSLLSFILQGHTVRRQPGCHKAVSENQKRRGASNQNPQVRCIFLFVQGNIEEGSKRQQKCQRVFYNFLHSLPWVAKPQGSKPHVLINGHRMKSFLGRNVMLLVSVYAVTVKCLTLRAERSTWV